MNKGEAVKQGCGKYSVEVEAFQYNGGKIDSKAYLSSAIPSWALDAYYSGRIYFEEHFKEGAYRRELFVKVSGIPQHVAKGDYIVRDVREIIYPCNPQAFRRYYKEIL